MGGNKDIEVFVETPFYVIHQIMAYHNIYRGINFDMYRGEDLSRSVVVDNEVMDSYYAVIAEGDIFDLLYQFRIGSFAQQRAYGLTDQTDTGSYDKQRYHNPHITVNLYVQNISGDNADEHCGGGNYIVAAVCAGCNQCE